MTVSARADPCWEPWRWRLEWRRFISSSSKGQRKPCCSCGMLSVLALGALPRRWPNRAEDGARSLFAMQRSVVPTRAVVRAQLVGYALGNVLPVAA